MGQGNCYIYDKCCFILSMSAIPGLVKSTVVSVMIDTFAYYYYYYYTIWMSLVTGRFFLVLLLNQRGSPPLGLQASHYSTFRIMCDVPSVAVFCSESMECLPGTASKFFLKLLVTIPVALLITDILLHYRFHIRCISVHKLLYFNFFSASFCPTFLSAGIAISTRCYPKFPRIYS
jgi:hypothetical protein